MSFSFITPRTPKPTINSPSAEISPNSVVPTEWKYLVKREHPWRQQLYVKGCKLLASTVWQDLAINQMSPEEAADNWSLPLDAIYEIIQYCETHQEILKLEADEERCRLIAKGVSFELKTAA